MVKLKWTLHDHGNKGFYGPDDAQYTRESKENARIFYDFVVHYFGNKSAMT